MVTGVEDRPVLASDRPGSLENETPSRRRRAGWIALAVLGAAVLGGLLYLASVKSFAADSDSATQLLEGKAMAAGHLTLNGWALSVDSFWSIDAVVNMLGVLVFGFHSMLVHLVPAVVAVVIVVLGVAMARDGRVGRASFAAGATVVALLGLPSAYLAYFFLRGPLHAGTALWAMVAFYALRRGRFGVGWVVAVLFLGAGVLGDYQMIGLGIGPLAVAGLAAMLRTRSWRRGAPQVAAAGGSLVVAVAIRKVAEAIGTYGIGKVQSPATFSQMVKNVKGLPTEAAHLFGVTGGVIGRGGVPAALAAVRMVGLIVVVAALVGYTVLLLIGLVTGSGRTDRRRPRHAARPASGTVPETWRLDDLLVLATWGGIVAFVVLATASNYELDRYLTAAMIFGCILGGRFIGRVFATIGSTNVLATLSVAGLAFFAVYAASFGIELTAPTPVSPAGQLGQFLEAHGLHNGIGDYWSASVTTVATDGAVTVRPVDSVLSGKIVRYQRQSDAAWYAGQSFDFVVYDVAVPGNVDATLATNTFGPPAHSYAVGTYRVLVWNHPFTVSPVGVDYS